MGRKTPNLTNPSPLKPSHPFLWKVWHFSRFSSTLIEFPYCCFVALCVLNYTRQRNFLFSDKKPKIYLKKKKKNDGDILRHSRVKLCPELYYYSRATPNGFPISNNLVLHTFCAVKIVIQTLIKETIGKLNT